MRTVFAGRVAVWKGFPMRPADDNQAGALKLLVGRGLSVACFLFAQHVTRTINQCYFIKSRGCHGLAALFVSERVFLNGDSL